MLAFRLRKKSRGAGEKIGGGGRLIISILYFIFIFINIYISCRNNNTHIKKLHMFSIMRYKNGKLKTDR